MTVVAPPFFFEFIQWITERAQAEERGASGSGWQSPPLRGFPEFVLGDLEPVEKTKRKVNAYNRRYGKAFKKCKAKHMKKNGTWKKGGFKRCVKEAHRKAKK